MTPSAAWFPRQHGAWAMIVVPFIVGCVLAARADVLWGWAVPLAPTVLCAYLGFNALSLWLRASPKRRDQYRRPVQVYGVTTAILAVITLTTGAWPMVSWLIVGAPLIGWAVHLAANRRDRDASGGLATVALACGVGIAIRFHTPAALIHALPAAWDDVTVLAWVFAYFAGTVWHVKALIRDRGQAGARRRSIAWHVAWTLTTPAIIPLGLSWAWPLFFLLVTARTVWMTSPRRTGRLPIMVIGMTEVVASLILLVVALT